MSWKKKAIEHQLREQKLSFHNSDRWFLMAGIIRRFVEKCGPVVDAGGGQGRLGNYFSDYLNWDLLDAHDIEESIPKGDVVVFSDVLEHVVDLKKTLANVKAKYVLVSVPVERDFPPSIDHVRRLDWRVIRELTDWELEGLWFHVTRSSHWRIRKFFGISSHAEEEITLWQTKGG